MELLTVDEVSELLKVSRNQVVLSATRGEMPALKVLGKLRFDATEIESWLKKNQLKAETSERQT